MKAGISRTISAAVQSLAQRGQPCLRRAPIFQTAIPMTQLRRASSDEQPTSSQEMPKETLAADGQQRSSAISRMSAAARAEKRAWETRATRPNEEAASLADQMLNVSNDPYGAPAPPYHLNVFSHKHNTHITLTRPNRDPMFSISCGNMGFRKAQRGNYDAAHQLSSYMMAKIQEKGYLMEIKRMEVILRGFGPGREAFTKVLLGQEGKNIRPLVVRVTDATRLKFGGTRSRNVRRLG
ncbi:hypothetical protein AJ80_00864 [Polytolypa hystricis UAMH7299]|uniref:Small ribosomal subunit protein uS11m n=1 Tax=Polytolypa hystricis (strain UAMH7299) TaxID=1447883 RepID=A0A2B7Z0D6_POLH7|nr:hypothetical protein AJ80_00864 [Polytolypa hystricis UAMH7299]